MPNLSDIIKDSAVEVSRLQDWMISAKEHGDLDIYKISERALAEIFVSAFYSG